MEDTRLRAAPPALEQQAAQGVVAKAGSTVDTLAPFCVLFRCAHDALTGDLGVHSYRKLGRGQYKCK